MNLNTQLFFFEKAFKKPRICSPLHRTGPGATNLENSQRPAIRAADAGPPPASKF